MGGAAINRVRYQGGHGNPAVPDAKMFVDVSTAPCRTRGAPMATSAVGLENSRDSDS